MPAEEPKKKAATGEPAKKTTAEEAKKKTAAGEPEKKKPAEEAAKKPPSEKPAKKPAAEEPVKKKKSSVRVATYYKIQDDGTLQRKLKSCPRCGPGTFLAEHYDRLSCGKCGYGEYKRKAEPAV
jgi:small subunit ribosomal protein S27Ae